MVVSLMLPSQIKLKNISHCNHDLTYEIELFPAALIRKWHPIHVAVFHNGKVILTGVKSFSDLTEVLSSMNSFLKQNNLM